MIVTIDVSTPLAAYDAYIQAWRDVRDSLNLDELTFARDRLYILGSMLTRYGLAVDPENPYMTAMLLAEGK